MTLKKEQKVFVFYCIILLIIMIVISNTMNGINLHKILNRVYKDGINYDDFRQLKLSEEMIEQVKDKIIISNNKNKIIDEKQYNLLNTADSLTLYMLINHYNLKRTMTIERKNKDFLLRKLSTNSSFTELRNYYYSIIRDIECFPVLQNQKSESEINFNDSWNSPRSYGGNRLHEGTDIMPEKNIRGYYHIVSITDGTIEKIGWLEKGGYRIGIRGNSGAYFYYAHLYSYAKGLNVGSVVKAGQLLGLMGDSGYGPEGTIGKFDVHLHVGIYVQTTSGEYSVNPYWILKYLENE